MEREPVKIGLLGLGTVGSGVVRLLEQNKEAITLKACRPIQVARVLVRDVLKDRGLGLDPSVLTADPREVLDNPDIEVIIEVMGGIDPARRYLLAALSQGKSVVTANKDLLAEHGQELMETAARHGTQILFEASVAGGIPIILPLKQSLAGNRIYRLMGIINGTTNYILSQMSQQGREFEEALLEAQRLGYAEADPSADVEGWDAARKLAILASIAFNTRISFKDVFVEGIRRVTAQDITYARELGYVIKLLGIAKEEAGKVEVRVHPTLIPRQHPLAAVNDVYNAVFVEGDAVGKAMFFGQGAGSMPTASSVVGDLILAVRERQNGNAGSLGCTCFYNKILKPMGEVASRFYLRLTVRDQPGVLAGIAGVFGNQEVSLGSVLQKRTEAGMAELVLVTHHVPERNLQDALAIISGLSTVAAVANVIRVEDD